MSNASYEDSDIAGEVFEGDEEISEDLQIFMHPEENVDLLSDIDPVLLAALTRFMWYAKKIESATLQDFAIQLLRNLVSKGRLGRKEYVQARAAYLANRHEIRQGRNESDRIL